MILLSFTFMTHPASATICILKAANPTFTWNYPMIMLPCLSNKLTHPNRWPRVQQLTCCKGSHTPLFCHCGQISFREGTCVAIKSEMNKFRWRRVQASLKGRPWSSCPTLCHLSESPAMEIGTHFCHMPRPSPFQGPGWKPPGR